MTIDQPGPPPSEAHAFLNNSALAGAIICPLVMLIPPRKLDLRFLVLSSAFSLSTNHLAHVYTGESIYARFQRRTNAVVNSVSNPLPPEAQRTQQLLREHRAAKEAAEKGKGGLAKVVDDVWMGGEDKDWQKKRLEEHQRSFDEGKGMMGIIMDQITDVVSGNWKGAPGGKKDGGEGAAGASANTSETKPSTEKR